MGYRGIDIRQSGDRLLFRASLKDTSGNKVISGTTTLRLFRFEEDGSLSSFDFDDRQFKTTSLVTATVSMTHQPGNNGTYDTGLWTYVLDLAPEEESSGSSSQSASESSSSGHLPSPLSAGNIIVAQVTNAGASPESQEREFQYGGGVLADIRQINGVDAQEADETLDVNVVQLGSSTTALAALKAMGLACTTGAVVADGSNTATTFKTGLTSGTTDYFGDTSTGGAVLVFTTGANIGIGRRITAFNTTTDFITVESAFPATPSALDEFVILGRIEI